MGAEDYPVSRNRQSLVIDSLSLSLRRRELDVYNQILVPTDGSEGTRGAVEHAIDLATTYNAALHTIYVVDTNVGIDTSIPETLDALEEVCENAIGQLPRGQAPRLVSELPLCRYTAEALKSPFAFTVPDFRAS